MSNATIVWYPRYKRAPRLVFERYNTCNRVYTKDDDFEMWGGGGDQGVLQGIAAIFPWVISSTTPVDRIWF